ncbi:protein SUPPRESSOR OF PHYA-105 1 [Dorcoceras hygrometricum]|uniref:Protein SUPPRESSOR OF PHYA-105 1 n=1 Tax=Dorcoceras hygrometricum TaxID=472368 RepID=A0A2Z7B6B6_9LAMI|nr:protein SUPPRESSOR OF PHYA-105 1 [Dorcoceras hygrometricum]
MELSLDELRDGCVGLPCFVVVLVEDCDARASGDSALSFPLCAEWLATTVHRLGVDSFGKGGRVGDARASGDSSLSFPLCVEWLATTVHRLGVDAFGKGGRVGETQVLQLVVVLTQLVVPQEVVEYPSSSTRPDTGKSVTVKAGSFDAVTHKRFLMMTAINGGVKINWGRLLFNIFKDMVTPGSRQARGYAVKIYILLKNVPNFDLGDSKEFPPLKVSTARTVGRYISINDKISVEEVEDVGDVSRLKKTPVKRAVSKKRPATAAAALVVKKKRTLNGKAAPSNENLELVSVAHEAVPLQVIKPIIAAPLRPNEKRQRGKRDVWDYVDSIIQQILEDTAQLEIDMGDTDEMVVGGPTIQTSDDFISGDFQLVTSEADRMIGVENDPDEERRTDDESMTLEEILSKIPAGSSLPSTTGFFGYRSPSFGQTVGSSFVCVRRAKGVDIGTRSVRPGFLFYRLLETSAVGSCVCWFGKLLVSTGFVGGQLLVLVPVVASAIYRKTWSSNCGINSILSKYFQPFVPYLSNPRTLFSRELSGDFPSFPVVVLLVRGRAAIPHSHLPAGIVATMRRVVNYHSSWAKQQQVELFDASGNPGSTAGHGFNPAGGAPGDTLPTVIEFFKLLKKRWADICLEAAEFFVSGTLLPVGSLNFCRALTAVEPAQDFGFRRPTVTSWGWSQLCTTFFRYSLFGGLQAVDISNFLSVLIPVRPVLRDANILDTVVQRAPVFLLTDTSTQEDPIVQMDIDQHPDSPLTSADSSLHFNANDIPTEEDSSGHQLILPYTATPTTTDIAASFAQLRASIDQVQFEQIRQKDDIDKLKDILLMHIRDLEKQFSDRFDQQDFSYRVLLNSIRQEIHDQKTLLSLDFLKSQKRISQVAAVATSLTDVQNDVQDTKDAFFHQLLPESSGFLAGFVVAQFKLPCGSSFPLFFGVSCIAPAFYSLLFISVVLLLSVLGFNPMSLRGLVCFFVALFSGNPGSTAGRGFNPAGGAPGGG